MRTTFLPFAMPDLGEAEIEAVVDSMHSGWITMGPRVLEFEKEFAKTVGARHAIAVNSCTAALHLALDAIAVGSGDFVVMSPYTFTATAGVVRYFGATPFFVDIEPSTCNIDVALLRQCVADLQDSHGDRVKAIIPVHIAGHPCEMEEIWAIAEEFELAVVDDAAHAFPATYNGRKIGGGAPGSISSAACFSFYATKTLTTGEGGMITTNDGTIAERCRIMRLHGISTDAWKRYAAGGSWMYDVKAPGYKYNMTDMAAGIGLVQLAKAEQMWRRRRDIAEQFTEAFKPHPALQTPTMEFAGQHAWHLYMLRLNTDHLEVTRDEFIERLGERNIGASVHFIPLHIHSYYREMYGFDPEDFPRAYCEYRREVSLPIYSKMSDQDVSDVIEAVLRIASVPVG